MRTALFAVLGLALAGAIPVPMAQAAQSSSSASTNKLASNKKPQKGVIYIKTKKFMSCRDWGKDRGWCSKHAQ